MKDIFTNSEKISNLTTGMESLTRMTMSDSSNTIDNSNKAKLSDTITTRARELDQASKRSEEAAKALGFDFANLQIKPNDKYIIVKPFETNPFMGEIKTEGGIILTSGNGQHLSEETGEWEAMEQEIRVGAVVEIGTNINYIKPGDAVFFDKHSIIPIPFMHQGWVLLHEGRVLAIVNNNLENR